MQNYRLLLIKFARRFFISNKISQPTGHKRKDGKSVELGDLSIFPQSALTLKLILGVFCKFLAFMQIICIFCNFCAIFSEAETTFVVIHGLFACLYRSGGYLMRQVPIRPTCHLIAKSIHHCRDHHHDFIIIIIIIFVIIIMMIRMAAG